MDLDAFIIAGCAVLGVDGSKTPLTGDGLEWAKLVKAKGGPLLFLLGYGDWDENEVDPETKIAGPNGSSAPSDKNGGDAIAESIGKWIKDQPNNLDGIIKQWLVINMQIQNPFGVGIDKDGVYWRTRRRPTPGWKVVDYRKTKGSNIVYVIETKKI